MLSGKSQFINLIEIYEKHNRRTSSCSAPPTAASSSRGPGTAWPVIGRGRTGGSNQLRLCGRRGGVNRRCGSRPATSRLDGRYAPGGVQSPSQCAGAMRRKRPEHAEIFNMQRCIFRRPQRSFDISALSSHVDYCNSAAVEIHSSRPPARRRKDSDASENLLIVKSLFASDSGAVHLWFGPSIDIGLAGQPVGEQLRADGGWRLSL